nr:hypothetical protein [Tanacetum cinerariifolium]
MLNPLRSGNTDRYCDYHQEKGHYTNDCIQLIKQLEMVLELGKLNHLVKDVRHKRRGPQGRETPQPAKVINVISVNSVKDMKRKGREVIEPWMNVPISFPAISSGDVFEKPLIVEAKVEGYLNKGQAKGNPNGLGRVYWRNIETRGKDRVGGRPGLKTIRAIPSTIHSMMKFPTPRGVATLVTRTIIIDECRRLKRKQMVEESFERNRGVEATEEVLINPSRAVPNRGTHIKRKPFYGSSCLKDYYPLPNIDCKVESVMGFKYKCFLDAYKGYHQIQMAKEDEKKTAFYTDQGMLYQNALRVKECRSHIPKSKDEKMLLADIVETFDNLKKINMKLNPKKSFIGVDEGKFLGYIVTSEGIRANPKKTKALADLQSPRTLKKMQSLSGKLAALNHFLAKSTKRSLSFFNTLKNITKENRHEFRWTKEAEKDFQQMKNLIMDLPSLTSPWETETLYVYLAVSAEAVSAVLLTDRKMRQCPVQRMRIYFEAHPVKVITDQPIKNILNNTKTSRKLAKIFFSDAPEGEQEELYFQMPEVPVEKDDIEIWTLFTDGASSRKGSGAGLVLIGASGIEYTYALRLTFPSTNNEAEYEALLAGLRIARQMNISNIEVKVDSKLVACQINENYEATKDSMIKYLAKAKEYASGFKSFSIENIPRNMNQKA